MTTLHRLDLAHRSSGAPSADPGLGAVIISDVLGQIGKPADVRTQITEELNTDGQIAFTLSIDDPLVTTDNFAVGKRELHWYRNGTLRWGGKLWRAEVDGRLVRFIGYGWFFDLRGREITDTYEQVRDQFLIVRITRRTRRTGTSGWTCTTAVVRAAWSARSPGATPSAR